MQQPWDKRLWDQCGVHPTGARAVGGSPGCGEGERERGRGRRGEMDRASGGDIIELEHRLYD